MILVREMSTRLNFLSNNNEYKNMVNEFRSNPYVVGIVGQDNELDSNAGLKMTPGISFDMKIDNKGQQYRTANDAIETGTDIIIVGRDIYNKQTNEDKLNTAKKFRNVAWNLYHS